MAANVSDYGMAGGLVHFSVNQPDSHEQPLSENMDLSPLSHESRDGPGDFAVSGYSRFLLLALAGGVALGLIACHRSDREAVHPVAGKVFCKGKPAEGATVTFVRRDQNERKTPPPGGQVGRDGSFRLSTYASYDGAPAGDYVVTIIYPSPERRENDENAGPDLLQGRYADPNTTSLAAEVKEGANDLEPFQLP